MNTSKKEIKKALKSIKYELKAVRDKPSEEVLKQPELISEHSYGEDLYYYRFPSVNQSIQYAETVEITIDEKIYKAKPVEFSEKGITLSFDKKLKEIPEQAKAVWINDFVLRRLLDELEYLIEADDAIHDHIEALFCPEAQVVDDDVTIIDDGQRNASQFEAIEKAAKNRAMFIWGPPGTGKTSTLGYIIVNFLVQGKQVLFASNTNRAVDIGMLSVLDALQNTGHMELLKKVTRYGDIALESSSLDEIHFEGLMEKKSSEAKKRYAGLKSLLKQYDDAKTAIKVAEDMDDSVSTDMRNKFKLLKQKVKASGGRDAIELEIEMAGGKNEVSELKKFKLVGTTLAKVCSSEVFSTLKFDAVVIDEASMANLPYLLVLSSKAREHVVAVGDPMQLPPIALTDHRKSMNYLEKDIFTHVSDAQSTEDLFVWHDQNPEMTAFFDVQYRLKSELAGLISSVFYENRLKSAAEAEQSVQRSSSNRSIFLLNSSHRNPYLVQDRSENRFSPHNHIHMSILERLTQKLVMQELVPSKEIGIIVPFRSCVYEIRTLMKNLGLPQIEVGTIHTYQGREKQVIIFDTIMSGEKGRNGLRHYSVRPFDEAKNGLSVHRLLNVAFSRSKSHLYVLADMNHIRQVYHNKFLGKLLYRMAESQSAYNV